MGNKMITLRPVTMDNVGQIMKLKADESLVASNAYSLAQAYVFTTECSEELLLTRGIYFDEKLIGFLMVYLELGPEWTYDNNGEPYFYLWRLMIDENHQDKGYGRKAMDILIDELKSGAHGNANTLYTSTAPASTVTPKFYRSFGMVPTGEMDEGETVLRMSW